MKKLCILALLLLTGCGNATISDSGAASTAPVPAPAPVTVYAVNQVGYNAARFSQGVADLNTQLSRDLAPAWGISAQVVEAGSIPNGLPSVVIQPASASPYTAESYANVTSARINWERAEAIDADGWEPVRCMSHETINMLMLRSGQGTANLSITDCCGGAAYAPTPGAAQDLCDFAFPSFCEPSGLAPYDVAGVLTAPLTPPVGGKLIYLAHT